MASRKVQRIKEKCWRSCMAPGWRYLHWDGCRRYTAPLRQPQHCTRGTLHHQSHASKPSLCKPQSAKSSKRLPACLPLPPSISVCTLSSSKRGAEANCSAPKLHLRQSAAIAWCTARTAAQHTPHSLVVQEQSQWHTAPFAV